ncbi:hypothetical protein [Anaerobacillus alkaliphilus]|uniref:hypothetical protein n=1 Tax=Anaerobacillus alkaliphilus TaxID=1548597 RepID=UPI00137586A5|nr:hypothetical protein [Anaerobacillus alkaliphilus]
MGTIKGYLRRKWHGFFMKRHLAIYGAIVDPIEKQKRYDKASFHATKLLRN